MTDYLKGLNKEQYQAATTIKGDVLILAGPGTGKTHTLVARTAYMIEQGVNPKEILILTFTNKAGMEIAERVNKSIGASAYDVTATTFHKFCVKILRKSGPSVGLKRDFIIKDSADAERILKICRSEYVANVRKKGGFINLKQLPTVKDIMGVYSEAINNDTTLTEVLDRSPFFPFDSEVKGIIEAYNDYKKQHNIVDFDDLLHFTHRLLKENPIIKKGLSNRYKYIMVDEYQDTNVIQNKIVNLLSEDNGNLAVIGDDNQSIYAFRCANIGNILDFEDAHPMCETITLNQNYRSRQGILDFSNAVLSHATEGVYKELKGQKAGSAPLLVRTANEWTETEYILDLIRKKHSGGTRLRDIAVMIRNSNQSFSLETKLNTEGIPYKKFGGKKFLEKPAVKDILAFLTVSQKPMDTVSWLHILPNYPGISDGFSRQISQAITDYGFSVLPTLFPKRKFNQYLREIYDTINNLRHMSLEKQLELLLCFYYPEVKKRCIDLSQKDILDKEDDWRKAQKQISEAKALIKMADKYTTTQEFLDDLVLDATSEEEQEGDYLIITTIHSAKGLEYDNVILMDCIEGVTPKCEAGDDQDSEELRAFYVAITRAKEALYLMCPREFKLSFKSFPEEAYLTHFMSYPNVIDSVVSTNY